MININRISIYVEGKLCYPEPNNQKEVGVLPLDSLAGYINRIVKELLSPNKESTHECNAVCKKVFAIVIGQTSNVCCMNPIEKSLPR